MTEITHVTQKYLMYCYSTSCNTSCHPVTCSPLHISLIFITSCNSQVHHTMLFVFNQTSMATHTPCHRPTNIISLPYIIPFFKKHVLLCLNHFIHYEHYSINIHNYTASPSCTNGRILFSYFMKCLI